MAVLKKAPPLPPKPRNKKPPKPSGLYVWWPLNDAPHTTDVGGTGSQIYKHAYPFSRFTSASNWGQFACTTAASKYYDPRIGGYCYNNSAAGGGHLTSSSSTEVTFISFGFEVTTISAWAYPTAAAPTTKSPVLHKAFAGGAVVSFALQMDQATNKWELQYTTGTVLKTTSSAEVISPNQWYHLVATYDGAVRRLYVNGVLSGSNAEVAAPDGTGEVWKFGNRQANDQVFPGRIWNVMMFSRVLRPSEIRELYLNPEGSFGVLNPSPTFSPNDPGPPPIGGTPGLGGIIVGDNAIPLRPGNLVIGPRSGHIPVY